MVKSSGYSGKSLSEKFGIKENMQLILLYEPKEFLPLISPLPANTKFVKGKNRPADIIICFLRSTEEIKLISAFKQNISDKGMIWCCWAKKTSPLFSGVTEDMIRNEALKHGLVDIKVCAVDENYSGLKIVKRKK